MKILTAASFIFLATNIISGCASIAGYAITENGCIKHCKQTQDTEYYLGVRLDTELIKSPINPHVKSKDIGLKGLAIIDTPLSLVIDTVFVPFIALHNLFSEKKTAANDDEHP